MCIVQVFCGFTDVDSIPTLHLSYMTKRLAVLRYGIKCEIAKNFTPVKISRYTVPNTTYYTITGDPYYGSSEGLSGLIMCSSLYMCSYRRYRVYRVNQLVCFVCPSQYEYLLYNPFSCIIILISISYFSAGGAGGVHRLSVVQGSRQCH